MGRLTRQTRTALEDGDMGALATALNGAQDDLRSMGVSHPALEQLLAVARQNGALAAKLTGSGQGGCLIALAPEASIANQYHKIGRSRCDCDLGRTTFVR